ncbi:tRNA (N6-threonylcarbamoyladenosine(37)-N6)-methyltransferase TrmO [Pseudonocardia sp.]|uniref:tRNA (N6-threonylcarbamoyladenosine(37)-N6)-methyltransferase TrmO n=1 Tax=Pseudonocardia sp. TaxID=60912 RepID=UPI0026098B17|nr:tRNA (N6-threonylcarbamoyladenosine(37)-N6)-methyltransferase TrmO [Pseudonocardia sp.]
MSYPVRPIGHVRSALRDPAQAPRQGDEGAPRARVVIEPAFARGMADLQSGTEVVVLTWLHLARRDELVTRPRDDPARPERGVFSTRSPHRPNPIGLHRVRIVAISGNEIEVTGLEAVDGTPVVDVKPVLRGLAER